jgi:hypothetical protein
MSIVFFRGTFSWPLFVVFLVFFLPFCWQLTKTLRAIFFWEKTTAVVQGADYVVPSSSNPSAKAITRVGVYTHQAIFQAKDGKTYQLYTKIRSNPPLLRVGESVSVYYDPANPVKGTIGGFLELWFPPLALGFLAGVFFMLWLGAYLEPPPASSSAFMIKKERVLLK